MTEFNRNHAAIALGVYATLALDAFGSVTSSPQTTELFAKDREDTLMKYVYLADAGAITIGVGASFVDGTIWPAIGAIVVVAAMHYLYVHAAKSGKNDHPPMTDSQREAFEEEDS